MVATTRLLVADSGDYRRKRSLTTSFAEDTASVPPVHQPGQVEWPDKTPDPSKNCVMTDYHGFTSANAFSGAVAAKARALPAGQREAVIFVHGYNNTMAEGLYRFAQIQHGFGFPSVPILYSWPSAAGGDYLHDCDSILFARTGLEKLIDQTNSTPVERIVLIGHSMGAQLGMSA